MQEISIVGFAQTPIVRETDQSEVEMVREVVSGALADAGIEKGDVDFWCSGSADLLTGRPFTFVAALDAIGAWPPVAESHVEMDGAWALYEAWVRLQHGEEEVALVYCFGNPSAGPLPDVMATQTDPYFVGPLWPDSISMAALQAQAMLDAGSTTEEEWAEIAARSLRDAQNNPYAQFAAAVETDALLEEEPITGRLRRHAISPISDGACAMVIARSSVTDRFKSKPVAIRGFDHRIDAHSIGARDITESLSTRIAADRLNVAEFAPDVAEIHAPFAHQEVILRKELGLGEGTRICPSGGALTGNPMMVAGLTRIGEAATAIRNGHAKRALGHATAGPLLQQNLICLLEER